MLGPFVRAAIPLLVLLPACGKKRSEPAPIPSTIVTVGSMAADAAAGSMAADAGAVATDPGAARPPKRTACPDEMALIDARFCVDRWEATTVESGGKAHPPHHAVGPKKVEARSQGGVLPQAYISAEEGDAACRRAGKHLCTTQQWQDACMGVARPYRIYPYGMEYEKGACNVARRLHPVLRVHGKYLHDSVILNDPKLSESSYFERFFHPSDAFGHSLFVVAERNAQKSLCFGTEGNSRNGDDAVLQEFFGDLEVDHSERANVEHRVESALGRCSLQSEFLFQKLDQEFAAAFVDRARLGL